jgi:hypothetical protein
MQELIEDVLAACREAERVEAGMPLGSSEHKAASEAHAGIRALFRVLSRGDADLEDEPLYRATFEEVRLREAAYSD